jgi:hypothetical protein
MRLPTFRIGPRFLTVRGRRYCLGMISVEWMVYHLEHYRCLVQRIQVILPFTPTTEGVRPGYVLYERHWPLEIRIP